MLTVALWAPTTSPFGGHKIQMEQTASHLNQTGRVEATVIYGPNSQWDRYDLVHGFGLDVQHVRQVRRTRRPVAISTIYCGKDHRLGQFRTPSPWTMLINRGRVAAVFALAAARGRHYEKAEGFLAAQHLGALAYESADLLLPNSELERQALESELAITTPIVVVPNAVDAALADITPESTRAGVLMVGRIEPHKNQLGLIRAMRRLDEHLTIVGDPHPDHLRYADTCRREADSRVTFVPQTRYGPELARYYASAAVHALPSFFETTGLASLEAGLLGCNVVTTSRGHAREYFGDMAWYCNPSDTQDIAHGIHSALSSPSSDNLRERILSHYTWAHTARQTADAYEALLEGRL